MDAKAIIEREIDSILSDPSKYASNICIPCHFIFTLVKELNLNESDAADMLTSILSEDKELNDRFIEAIEFIHMNVRKQAMRFYSKDRDAKDRYIELYVRNAITELKADARYGKDIMLRRLVLSYLSGYLAQTLGLDYHPSTEELYYVLRKNKGLEDFIREFIDYVLHG